MVLAGVTVSPRPTWVLSDLDVWVMFKFRVSLGTQFGGQLEPWIYRICVPFFNWHSAAVAHEVRCFKKLIYVLADVERLVQIYLIQRGTVLQGGLLHGFVNLKGLVDAPNKGCLVIAVTLATMTLFIIFLIRKPHTSRFKLGTASVPPSLILHQRIIRTVFWTWCLQHFL